MSIIHVIDSYVHDRRIAVLIQLRAESDYATRTDEFQHLSKDIAMHIAACSPDSVDALLQQAFVKVPSLSIEQLIANVSASLREHIAIIRFVRWDTNPTRLVQPEPPKSPAVVMRMQRG